MTQTHSYNGPATDAWERACYNSGHTLHPCQLYCGAVGCSLLHGLGLESSQHFGPTSPTFAKGSAGTQYGSCSGGGPSGRHCPAALKLCSSSVEHAVSQQQPGVHVPFSSAHMQLLLRLAAASGFSGTSDQSTDRCWKGSAAAAAGCNTNVEIATTYSSSTSVLATCLIQNALTGLPLLLQIMGWGCTSAARASQRQLLCSQKYPTPGLSCRCQAAT